MWSKLIIVLRVFFRSKHSNCFFLLLQKKILLRLILNKHPQIKKKILHPCSVFLDVYSVLFLFSFLSFSFNWLYVCAFAIHSIVHSGVASSKGLPYYCKPPVCVHAVIGALAVCRQNINHKKNCHAWLGQVNLCFRGKSRKNPIKKCRLHVCNSAFWDLNFDPLFNED